MAEEISIKRRPPRAPDGSFEQLRSEGIRLLQDLSGQQWTDFNLHDPGITILEQLCYAITDLMYRADLPVADLLTGHDGKIDFVRQSLHVPEQIYACRPTTVEDMRRALLDRVSSVDNLIITTGADAGGLIAGFYRIDVKAADLLEDASGDKMSDEPSVLQQIGAAFRSIRNIGEDVAVISLVAEVPCWLYAEIEIGGARDPVDIIADIYDCCDRFIAAPPSYGSIADMKAANIAPDNIFDGPPFQSGIIQPERAGTLPKQLFVGDISRKIAAIDGVKEVKSVAIAVGEDAPQTGAINWCWRTATVQDNQNNHQVSLNALRLIVPTTSQSLQAVKLLRSGAPVRVAVREAALKFADLRATRQARRQPDPGRAAYPHPRGAYLELPPFQSSQIHFPGIYGLNHYGMPESATAREKTAMLQLKGFLALCDQVMAHAATQFEHVRDLYSADLLPAQSYWWRMLSNEELPGINGLYKRLPKLPAETMPDVYAAIVRDVYATFDPHMERKSRLLDYLLALYGETFSQDYLRKFSSYYDETELKYWLLKNKAAFVKDIVLLGRDRVGGFDYGESAWGQPDNCAGLQRCISRLLGFDDFTSRSLTQAISGRHLSLDDAISSVTLSHEEHENVFRLPFNWPPIPANKSGEIDAKVKSILRRPILGQLMKTGLHRSNYRIQNVDGESRCELLLDPRKSDDDPTLRGKLFLDSCASWEEAAMVAARLRGSLLGLNQKCEGMHLVEHCLLRPSKRDADTAAHDAYYALRVTLIFPAWTARSHLDDFRRFVDETVQLNCPAHVHAQCIWLEFDAMRTFEICYQQWLQAKAKNSQQDRYSMPIADEQLDRLAVAVISQLQANGANIGQSPTPQTQSNPKPEPRPYPPSPPFSSAKVRNG